MGETALVTGASSGLGRYVATRLTAEGWDVLGTGLRPEDELKEPGLFSYLQADLSLPDSCSTVTDRLDGTPDLVVHCAVAYPPQGAPTPAELESVMRVNALAPYFLTMDVLASRPADRFCSCVVVNSEVVFAADEHSAPYAASKAALRMLTAGLAAACRGGGASVATLLLGPLASPGKLAEIEAIAARRGTSPDEIRRLFLRRSNPNLVIEDFIDYESCYRSIRYIAGLGPAANGMMCRLDGGSSGWLM